MLTICHMVISLDGRTTGDFLTTPQGLAAAEHYYEINRTDPAQAYACGRTTMEGSFTGGHQPDWAAFESARVPAGDFVATLAPRYAVCFDRCADSAGRPAPCKTPTQATAAPMW